MDTFAARKRYASAVDQELTRAGFPDTSYSVTHDEGVDESCAARCTWAAGSSRVNAKAWPAGLSVVWSSLGAWTYEAQGENGAETSGPLPVPPLAAPRAVSSWTADSDRSRPPMSSGTRTRGCPPSRSSSPRA
ncbi:hypothetical protein ADL21_07700 [Streptomyces albus subsp. albus]|nr:hypothetical protein ADL21_07700 [Streptomyces albus subsp. albus]